MSPILTWLALWLIPGLMTWAWVRADEYLACRGWS